MVQENEFVSKAELYQSYVNWCETNKENILSRYSFNLELQNFCPTIKEFKTKIRKWRGIAIR